MKKNNTLMIITFIIIALIYNIILFTAVDNHTQIFWSAYSFTMLAFVSTSCLFYNTLREKFKTKAKFFNLPIPILASFYLIIQVVLGIVLMAITNMSVVTAYILQIVLFGVFAVVSILSLIGTNVANDFDDTVNKKVFYIKSLASDVDGLINSCGDAETKKLLVQLCETIKYGDPMSHSSLMDIENQISMKMYNLTEVIDNKNFQSAMQICDEITRLVIDRNNKCKILK